jgi:prepilin-type N-terminal cleavage/methylation domain-containing protein
MRTRRRHNFRTPAGHRRHARGFTLPEVLATMLLVGIVLPAAMRGVSMALAASDDARKKMEATALAENKLAELTADLILSQAQADVTPGGQAVDQPPYTIEPSVVSVEAELAEVSVRVSWTARGEQRSVVLSSLVYGAAAATTGTATEDAAAAGGAQ